MWRSEILICFDAGVSAAGVFGWKCVVLVGGWW